MVVALSRQLLNFHKQTADLSQFALEKKVLNFNKKCPSTPTKNSATPKQGKDAEDRHGGQV